MLLVKLFPFHIYICAQLYNWLTTACSHFPWDGFFHKQLPHLGSFSSNRPPTDWGFGHKPASRRKYWNTHLDNGLWLEVNVSIKGQQECVFRSHLFYTTSHQPFISKSKQSVDPPLFGRPSTKGYPSIGGQGSSTCTWSGTTWKPFFFWMFQVLLPFLVPDLVFVFQVADNFCFPRQSPDLKEEVEVLDITRSQRVLPDVLRKAWQSSLVAGCEASSSRTWSFLKMSCQ